MKRRHFLHHLLTGGAVLSTFDKRQIEQQIQAPASDDPGTDRPPDVLNWRDSVRDRHELPHDAREGDAVYVENWYASFVYVQGVGWIRMSRLSGGFFDAVQA